MTRFLLTTTIGLVISVQAFATGKQLKNLPAPTKGQTRVKVTDRVWPAKYGEGHICLWKDDKLAAFSVTIDDNTKPDHEMWVELGKKYGWHWTWFVITGNVMDGKNPGFCGKWEDWQRLRELGHDVQSHTVRHRSKRQKEIMSIDDEYKLSQEHLDANVKNSKCVVLAYPGGGYPNDPDIATNYYIGARGTRGVLNNRDRINYTNTNSLSGIGSFFKEEKHWASFAGVLNPENKRKFRSWVCTHFHGAKKVKDDIVKVLDHVKKNEKDVWVGLFREVVQYGQEGDTAKLTMKEATPEKVSFKLTDDMDDQLFDFPLTIKVRLDKNWKSIKASQGGKSVKASLTEHDGAVFALVQAVPDQGDIVLTK